VTVILNHAISTRILSSSPYEKPDWDAMTFHCLDNFKDLIVEKIPSIHIQVEIIIHEITNKNLLSKHKIGRWEFSHEEVTIFAQKFIKCAKDNLQIF